MSAASAPPERICHQARYRLAHIHTAARQPRVVPRACVPAPEAPDDPRAQWTPQAMQRFRDAQHRRAGAMPA